MPESPKGSGAGSPRTSFVVQMDFFAWGWREDDWISQAKLRLFHGETTSMLEVSVILSN